MRDPKEFQEIEDWGEDEKAEPPVREETRREGGGSFFPLLQAALCALALLALVILRFADPEAYGKAADWYKGEAAKEIELPRFSASSSAPAVSDAPMTAELEYGEAQRV